MQRIMSVVGVALATALFSLPALAATATCNGGGGFGSVFIDISTSDGSPSCAGGSGVGFGNGTVLNTASDPMLSRVLDTTQPAVNGLPTLTVNFAPPILGIPNTDGTFSFNTAGYQNFYIGFQLNTQKIGGILPDPDPDWFVFNLAGITLGSGSFDADLHIIGPLDLTSDSIKYVVLYGDLLTGGNQNETPLPGAVFLFGSVLAGGIGVRKWRGRRGNSRPVAA